MKTPSARSPIVAAPARFLRRLAGAAWLLALTLRASACSVCMGSDSPQLATAANSVLWALLALVGFIFLATGLTAWFLLRRAARQALTPEQELINSLPDDDSDADH